MLLLTDRDVRELLSLEQFDQPLRRALGEYAAGEAEVPPRAVFQFSADERQTFFMSGSLPKAPALGMKVVSTHGLRPEGLTTTGLILLLEPETGQPAALVDGKYITDIRTAAMTALACQYVPRLSASQQAVSLGIVGAGTQAHAHLDYFAAMRSLKEVRLWSRTRSRVEHLRERAKADCPSLNVRAVDDAEEAVRGADIVVLATSSRSPVVADEWLEGVGIVCGVGSNRPDAAEIPPETVGRADAIVIDARSAALAESGDLIGPMTSGHIDESRIVELGELVLGRSQLPIAGQFPIVFKSVGTAIADLGIAAEVLRLARVRGGATDVEL